MDNCEETLFYGDNVGTAFINSRWCVASTKHVHTQARPTPSMENGSGH